MRLNYVSKQRKKNCTLESVFIYPIDKLQNNLDTRTAQKTECYFLPCMDLKNT